MKATPSWNGSPETSLPFITRLLSRNRRWEDILEGGMQYLVKFIEIHTIFEKFWDRQLELTLLGRWYRRTNLRIHILPREPLYNPHRRNPNINSNIPSNYLYHYTLAVDESLRQVGARSWLHCCILYCFDAVHTREERWNLCRHVCFCCYSSCFYRWKWWICSLLISLLDL